MTANVKPFQQSFGGGELTPEFYGRIDDAKYAGGVAKCRNFLTKPHGPAENRAGFRYVTKTPSSGARKARLIPFSFSTTQTAVLEFSDQRMRIITNGALVTVTPATWVSGTTYTKGDTVRYSGGNYYCKNASFVSTVAPPSDVTNWWPMTDNAATGVLDVPTSIVEADLQSIRYVQSADVMTITSPQYAPVTLSRYSATKWAFDNINVGAKISAPGGVTASATSGTGSFPYSYVVTALTPDSTSESVASSSASCNNNLLTSGSYNTITWSAVTGAAGYRVYKLQGGLYGFIGQTSTALSIIDNNIAADIGITPPNYDTNATTAKPAAVSYFEQRKVFAGGNTYPQSVWMTKSGTEAEMAYSIPLKDDDRIAVRIAARDANSIQHVVPLRDLIVLTTVAEWVVTSPAGGVVTPTDISMRPHSYVGANAVQPITTGNALLFASAAGGHVRAMAYSFQSDGYVAADLSLRAVHLFDGYDIADLAYSKTPYPILWAVSTNGKLLSATYLPEQEVLAWHQHDTGVADLFEACATVRENGEDVLYVVVKRFINGAWVRFIERQASRRFTTAADSFFVDCGVTYSGAPATSITGLSWLEGMTVNVLTDGSTHRQCVVGSGAITLDYAASVVQVGLPITAEIQTLPLALLNSPGAGQGGAPKNTGNVWFRVSNTLGLKVGPDSAHLRDFRVHMNQPLGSPPTYETGEIEVQLTPSWGADGQILIQQSLPLPATIESFVRDVTVGG